MGERFRNEVLEREEKGRFVLMVVGDAAKKTVFCSLSLVLVYRRIILLSTD